MIEIYVAIILGITVGYMLGKMKIKRKNILDKTTTASILLLIFVIGVGIGLELHSISIETLKVIMIITALNIVIPVLIEASMKMRI